MLFVVQVMSDISKQDCIHNKRITQRTKMRFCIHHKQTLMTSRNHQLNVISIKADVIREIASLRKAACFSPVPNFARFQIFARSKFRTSFQISHIRHSLIKNSNVFNYADKSNDLHFQHLLAGFVITLNQSAC